MNPGPGRPISRTDAVLCGRGVCAVDIDTDGKLHIRAPKSRAGDSMLLRAEMDLAIAVSACPASTCNGGGATKPLAYEVFD